VYRSNIVTLKLQTTVQNGNLLLKGGGLSQNFTIFTT